jgi:membrane dipeptidase
MSAVKSSEFLLAASALIERSLVWENHCCMPFNEVCRWMPEIGRYKAAGFDVVHINIGDADIPLDRIVRVLASFRAWLAMRAEDYVLATGVRDILNASGEGRLAVCFDIEGAQALGTDLDLISMFYQLGVRWMLMAYNCTNAVGGGCHELVDEGLTKFGREFVAEMDRVGMIKDVAHTGYRTAMDVIETSSVPVNISHSNPRALNDHPRCVPDNLMRACASSGGVMGICGLGLFLGRNDTSTENMIRGIDYSVNVMGIDHVGLGLDYVFDQSELIGNYDHKRHIWPEGFGYGAGTRFVPPEQLSEIVEALLARGYRDADVVKILGGNFLRVAQEVWK